MEAVVFCVYVEGGGGKHERVYSGGSGYLSGGRYRSGGCGGGRREVGAYRGGGRVKWR